MGVSALTLDSELGGSDHGEAGNNFAWADRRALEEMEEMDEEGEGEDEEDDGEEEERERDELDPTGQVLTFGGRPAWTCVSALGNSEQSLQIDVLALEALKEDVGGNEEEDEEEDENEDEDENEQSMGDGWAEFKQRTTEFASARAPAGHTSMPEGALQGLGAEEGPEEHEVSEGRRHTSVDPRPQGTPAGGAPPRGLGDGERDRLCGTYRRQALEGEARYAEGQYVPAVACFQDARLALLRVTGEGDGDDPAARWRDRLNSKFSWSDVEEDGTADVADFAHINYRQTAALVEQVQSQLTAVIEKQRLVANIQAQRRQDSFRYLAIDVSAEADTEGGGQVLTEVLKEATLSLARIRTKQGCVNAKFEAHRQALHLFEESLAGWQEAAGEKANEDVTADSDDSLTVETYALIRAHGEPQDSSGLPLHGAHSLEKNLNALSTALHMAKAHHAIASEKMGGKETTTNPSQDNFAQIRAALNHHLHALRLVCEIRRLRAAYNESSNKSSTPGDPTARFVGAAQKIVNANRLVPGGGRLSAHALDLGVLKNDSYSKDIVDNVKRFMEHCKSLVAQQQVCISHACFSLGSWSLSSKWLSRALDNIDELGLSDVKEKAKASLDIISLIKTDHGSDRTDRMSLFEAGVLACSGGCKENPRLYVHFALEALERRLFVSAMTMLNEVAEVAKVYGSLTPPGNQEEYLHAINAQIIMLVEQGDMEQATSLLLRRVEMVSRWIDDSSFELARDLLRLGCLYSSLGQHEQSVRYLEKSLHVGSTYEEYGTMDCTKLLAISYDNMSYNDSAALDTAICKYKCALSMEKDVANKAKLTNALSFLLFNNAQTQLAVEYLNEPIEANRKATNENLDDNSLCNAMILYGDIMSHEECFSEAIDWYNSALSSNPDKRAIHPSNLRALLNKGLVLMKNGENGDILEAGHVLGRILDEVDISPETPPIGVASVLNAVGSINYVNADFEKAIQRFTESLSLENGCLTQCQRAAILCNIGSAHFRIRNYEESENYLSKALMITESLNEASSDLEATILCKLAYILYKRKDYRGSHDFFSDAALTDTGDSDDEFSLKCEGYAVTCYLRLTNQYCNEDEDDEEEDSEDVELMWLKEEKGGTLEKEHKVILKKQMSHFKSKGAPKQSVKRATTQLEEEVTAKEPKFERRLILVTDDNNTTRYSSAVYPWNVQIGTSLNVNTSSCGLVAYPPENRKILCNKALECLLKQTEHCRAKYALEHERFLVKELNSKFIEMKSWE